MAVNDIKKGAKDKSGKSAMAKCLRMVAVFIIIVLVVGAGAFVFLRVTSSSSEDSSRDPSVFTVGRGPLTISVTESGDIKAVNSEDIKSEVEGRTTIISIVDEGTYITLEDVNNGKILVELDSSDIEQKLTQQQISYIGAKASFTEATESLDIQKKQNDSDIQAGKMKVRFALMDLKKYLGEEVADIILAEDSNSQDEQNRIAELIEDPCLGGEAVQKLRELDGDIHMRKQELELAESKYDWTEKLYKKEYVSLRA